MKTILEIEERLEKWAGDKNLIVPENAGKQAEKTQEELDEMKFNIKCVELGITSYTNKKGVVVNPKDEIKDDIGDQIVTLAIQCKIQNTSLTECFNVAWDEIEHRKGKTVNGIFVKE